VVTKLVTVESVVMNVGRNSLGLSVNFDIETREQEAIIRPTAIFSRHGIELYARPLLSLVLVKT